MRFKQNEEGYWMPVNDAVSDSKIKSELNTQNSNFEISDYINMPDETLAELAAERQIDTTDKTRRQVINLLKKTE